MIIPFLAACGGLAAGSVATRVLLERRQKQRLLKLEREMTRQIRVRYEAYLGLEERVRLVIAAFDLRETEATQALEVQSQQIEDLTREVGGHVNVLEQTNAAALAGLARYGRPAEDAPVDRTPVDRTPVDRTPGVGTPATGTKADGTWLFEQRDSAEHTDNTAYGDDALDPDEAFSLLEVSHEEPRTETPMDFDLEDFERRLQNVHEQKQAQIDRQQSLIAELTDCVMRLKPMPSVLEQRERELVELRDQYDELGRTTKGERTTAQSKIDGLMAEIDRREEMIHELTGELNGLRQEVAARAEEVRMGSERLAELEVSGQETIADLEGEVERISERLAQRTADVQTAEMRIGELEPLAEECERRRKEVQILQDTYRELQNAKESEISALHERMHELEETRRELDMLRPELESIQGELQAVREELATTAHERDERTRELQELQGQVGTMTSKLSTTEESLSGQRTRIADLMRALEDAEEDLEAKESSLAGHESTLEQAQSVVAELRPTIETLEEKMARWTEGDDPES